MGEVDRLIGILLLGVLRSVSVSQEVEDTTNLEEWGVEGHSSKCLQLFLKTFFTEKVL